MTFETPSLEPKNQHPHTINYIIYSVIFLMVCSICTASQGNIEKINWKGEISTKNITIKNPYGDVRLRFSDTTNILEYNTIYQHLDKSKSLQVSHTENNKQFTVSANPLNENNEEQKNDILSRVDIVAYIPKGITLYVESSSGLIEAKGLESDIHLKTLSGNISVNKIKGAVNTSNDSGKTTLILKDLGIDEQTFTSKHGSISVLLDQRSNFKVEMSTSGDFISDFSTTVESHDYKEPNKTAIIKINKANTLLKFISKRGNVAVRRYKKY